MGLFHIVCTPLQIFRRWISFTHQNASSGGLAGDELARPVLGLGDEGALKLLFVLALGALLLLLGVVGRELGLLAAEDEGQGAPYQHDGEPRQEGEDAREQEAPPLAHAETFGVDDDGRRLLRAAPVLRHAARTASGVQRGLSHQTAHALAARFAVISSL
jgi:hypothetical protein